MHPYTQVRNHASRGNKELSNKRLGPHLLHTCKEQGERKKGNIKKESCNAPIHTSKETIRADREQGIIKKETCDSPLHTSKEPCKETGNQ